MINRTRHIGCILFVLSLLPMLSGCNNKDDVIEVFTGKTWKLSRLTNEGSSAQFYPGLWQDEKAANNSKEALKVEDNFTLIFEGSELNGELMGARISGQGIRSNFSGSWSADGKSQTVTLLPDIKGTESDALANAFIKGLKTVYQYEGNANSLTLFFKDGNTIRVMGFSRKR